MISPITTVTNFIVPYFYIPLAGILHFVNEKHALLEQ